MHVPGRRAPLVVAVWAAGVVLATGTGLLAVRLVADAVGDPAVPVLSAEDVRDATPPARPAPSLAAPPAAAPAAPVRVFSSTGGSVGVRCRGTLPEPVYATPAQGWALDESGLEGTALEVRFESGRTRARLTIGCRSGAPTLLERRTDTSGKG